MISRNWGLEVGERKRTFQTEGQISEAQSQGSPRPVWVIIGNFGSLDLRLAGGVVENPTGKVG